MIKIGLILVVIAMGLNNFRIVFSRIVAGFNLPNNNVYAVSLARTHREMQTSFFEIGGVINTDLRPAAVGPYCTPNFSEFGTHLPMRPRQTHRIPPVRTSIQ